MTELKNMSYWYDPGKPVIRDASMEVADGRIYGLLGLNGSGKSTLLKLMAGLLFPKEGQILHNGINAGDRNPVTLQDIAFMPAEISLPKENPARFVSLHSVFYPRFSRHILEDCMKEFGIDPETPDLEKLSLGYKHRFMLSYLLSLGTGIILLDEPLNGMDSPSRNIFRRLLMRHLRDDQTVVISTHIMNDVEKIVTDIIIVKNDGTLFCASMGDMAEKYSYGISASPEGALYAENCAEGFRVLRENTGNGEGDIPVEILFNAVTKGAIQ